MRYLLLVSLKVHRWCTSARSGGEVVGKLAAGGIVLVLEADESRCFTHWFQVYRPKPQLITCHTVSKRQTTNEKRRFQAV